MKEEKWEFEHEKNRDVLGLTKYVDRILADLEKSGDKSRRRVNFYKQKKTKKKEEYFEIKEFPFVF